MKAAIFALMLSGFGWRLAAAEPSIQLVVDNDSAFSRETAGRLQALLDQSRSGIAVEKVDAASLDAAPGRLIVTVGEQAWKAAATFQGEVPILAVMPSRTAYAAENKRQRSAAAIFLDQPVERVLNLAGILKPQDPQVGVVLGAATRNMIPTLQAAANERGQRLYIESASEEATVGRVLAGVIRNANMLLAIPDPVVQTVNTVQPFLLMSYRAGIPVIGYSAAYQRAGAMVSLYSTPEQIARQAGEAIIAWRQGKGLSGMHSPKYFTVGINTAVARSLGVTVPSAESIEQKLRTMKE